MPVLLCYDKMKNLGMVEEQRNSSAATKTEACTYLSSCSQETQLQQLFEVCPENGTKDIQLLSVRNT